MLDFGRRAFRLRSHRNWLQQRHDAVLLINKTFLKVGELVLQLRVFDCKAVTELRRLIKPKSKFSDFLVVSLLLIKEGGEAGL